MRILKFHLHRRMKETLGEIPTLTFFNNYIVMLQKKITIVKAM